MTRQRTEDEEAEPAYRGAMDFMNLDEMTKAEVDATMVGALAYGRPLYTLYAMSLQLDYAPVISKLDRWFVPVIDGPQENTMMLAVQNMHSYMWYGWETGIRNTFHTLIRTGLVKQQIMEIIHFGMIYSGMRGMGHTYRAAGDLLAILREPAVPVVYPAGWAPDPAAFDSHMDMTKREMTAQDVKNLTEWYERNVGFLPKSIKFGMKYHPELLKADRRKWEVALRTVPKQFAPYNLIRQHLTTGHREGLREAVLLGKSWGINREWLLRGIVGSAFYFTSAEALYTAEEAVGDLL
jgi:hypothetical protein